MPDIRETKLPGVGLEFDFTTRNGDHIGVVARHTGRRELVVFDDDDPDSVASRVELTEGESAALAELLGGTRVTAQLAALGADVEGLVIDWIPLPRDFRSVTIGETEMRSRTGSSLIAILREGRPVPAPGPDDELLAGDVAVLVGTKDGIAKAVDMLGA